MNSRARRASGGPLSHWRYIGSTACVARLIRYGSISPWPSPFFDTVAATVAATLFFSLVRVRCRGTLQDKPQSGHSVRPLEDPESTVNWLPQPSQRTDNSTSVRTPL